MLASGPASPWSFHAHYDVWILVAGLAFGSWWALRRLGPRIGAPPPTKAQVRCLILGLLSLWIGADWPIHDLAEGSLYSAHMIQHMIFTLAAAPLLMMGTPPWLARRLLSPPGLLRLARFLTRPLIALVIFNAVLVLTHWPAFVTASVGNEAVHLGAHTLLFASALIVWTPVVSPILELPRLSYPGQMLFLFLQSLVPTVPASFLTFGSQPLYHVYEAFPRLWGISALTDQRTAGLIMKILGGFVLWGVIAVIFFRWYGQEQREGTDALTHRSVDRDLNRMELTR